MKPLENITIHFTDPEHWVEQEKAHTKTLDLLLKGQVPVPGVDVLKAGLFLVSEVVRRMETPSFRVEMLRHRMKRVHLMAFKWSALLQCWPGGTPPSQPEIDDQKRCCDMVDLLVKHSPERKPGLLIDTSGDI